MSFQIKPGGVKIHSTVTLGDLSQGETFRFAQFTDSVDYLVLDNGAYVDIKRGLLQVNDPRDKGRHVYPTTITSTVEVFG